MSSNPDLLDPASSWLMIEEGTIAVTVTGRSLMGFTPPLITPVVSCVFCPDVAVCLENTCALTSWSSLYSNDDCGPNIASWCASAIVGTKPETAAATQSTRARSRRAFPTSQHSFRRPVLLHRFAFSNERPTLSPGGIPGPQPRHAAVRRKADPARARGAARSVAAARSAVVA